MKIIPSKANDDTVIIRCYYCNKKVPDGAQCETTDQKENCPNGSMNAFKKQLKTIFSTK